MIRTLFLMIVSVLAVSGQVTIKEYKPHVMGDNGRYQIEMSMPFISDTGKNAWKMNTFIYQSELERKAPTSLTAPMQNFDYGLSSTWFETNRNDHLVLSIMVGGEGCGASCSEWNHYYNFDPSNGRIITIYDLLSREGMVKLSKRLLPYWQSFGDSLDLDSESMDQFFNKRFVGLLPFITDYMIIGNQTVKLIVETGKTYERDFGDLEIEYSFNVLKPYLSDYGRRILLGEENNAIQPNNLLDQLYKGTIGNSIITLMITGLYDSEFSGFYYYDKYGEQIPLSVKSDGTMATFTCGENETIKAKITPNGLVGTWKSKGKTLPFKVSLE